jgi:hypothetical protein
VDPPLAGTWDLQADGMEWRWTFKEDGSLTWSILGQTDMGGRALEVGGGGRYSLAGKALVLELEKFPGLPGAWRSADAPPGFDPVTRVRLRFSGRNRLRWSFSTEALGEQELEAQRLK